MTPTSSQLLLPPTHFKQQVQSCPLLDRMVEGVEKESLWDLPDSLLSVHNPHCWFLLKWEDRSSGQHSLLYTRGTSGGWKKPRVHSMISLDRPELEF